LTHKGNNTGGQLHLHKRTKHELKGKKGHRPGMLSYHAFNLGVGGNLRRPDNIPTVLAYFKWLPYLAAILPY